MRERRTHYRRAEDVTEGLLASVPSPQVDGSLVGALSNIYIGISAWQRPNSEISRKLMKFLRQPEADRLLMRFEASRCALFEPIQSPTPPGRK